MTDVMVPTALWAQLAAPFPPEAISWRQDGKPQFRDGKHFARFVAYIDSQDVRERLDAVFPGEWDTDLTLLPPAATSDGEDRDQGSSFLCKLTVAGRTRTDVGTGKDYKSAASDAFKRAAVRFGVGHELYAMKQNWVQVDGDSKFAKPLEDPQAAYTRRYGGATAVRQAPATRADVERIMDAEPVREAAAPAPARVLSVASPDAEEHDCPTCGGRMWDNRATKRNPKAPDFKCRDKSCDGVIWPPKEGKAKAAPRNVKEEFTMDSGPLATGTDDIPF